MDEYVRFLQMAAAEYRQAHHYAQTQGDDRRSIYFKGVAEGYESALDQFRQFANYTRDPELEAKQREAQAYAEIKARG